jgi:4-phospho-D-threonate 3-dehydrogenase / 4-phospho-D-erythronate 3-dehydrogenase
MGDPAGCGPEIVARVLSDPPAGVRLVCVGDAAVLAKALPVVGSTARLHPIRDLAQADFDPGTLEVLDLRNVDLSTLQIGKVQPAAGQAAYEYVTTAIDLAMAAQVAGVVTSALNKEALHQAGHKFDGHTQIFSERTQAKSVTMMLASGSFRVTHVSTHVALRQAVERVKPARIVEVIRLTVEGVRMMGVENPRIAVAGLNPHSGEGGIFGREEIEQVQPAIDEARSLGFSVHPQPVPGDTVFVRMREFGEFDAVVAQYHDQGHVAAKLVDFWGGVNITLGLPIIRTSVDHGTAFDVAYTGRANPKSLVNAIEYACLMARHRK